MNLKNKPWLLVTLAGLLLGTTWILVFGPKLPSENDQQVVITNEDLNYLAATWVKTWQRQPTKQELTDAVESYVRDEILYREALKRDFDKNNGQVKRSLIMQMNILAEGQGRNSSINDESIAAYYELRKENFLRPGRISFQHIYYNSSKRKSEPESYINPDLATLASSSPDITEMGDPIMLARVYDNVSEREISRNFGEAFALEIMTLPAGEWIGPVASAYGVHLIYISDKSEPQPAPIDEVRSEIIREMEFEEKEAAKEQFYTELIRQYNVVYQDEVKNLIQGE